MSAAEEDKLRKQLGRLEKLASTLSRGQLQLHEIGQNAWRGLTWLQMKQANLLFDQHQQTLEEMKSRIGAEDKRIDDQMQQIQGAMAMCKEGLRCARRGDHESVHEILSRLVSFKLHWIKESEIESVADIRDIVEKSARMYDGRTFAEVVRSTTCSTKLPQMSNEQMQWLHPNSRPFCAENDEMSVMDDFQIVRETHSKSLSSSPSFSFPNRVEEPAHKFQKPQTFHEFEEVIRCIQQSPDRHWLAQYQPQCGEVVENVSELLTDTLQVREK